jgi:hypothetical protein
MDQRFEQISRQDIEKACDDIISGVHKDFANSTSFSVVYKGYDLPPKAVISRAYYQATGQYLPVQGEEGFYGGAQSNSFLENHGFEIVNRPSDKTLKSLSA